MQMPSENNLDSKHTYLVSGEDPVRLDLFLTEQSDLGSRSHVQKYIKQHCITINTLPVHKTGTMVFPGDVITFHPKQANEQLQDSSITFPICYEDAHVMIINKPSGFVVFAARPDEAPYAIATYVGTRMLDRGGILHRLDKETSGLLMIAKTPEGAQYYGNLFATRNLTKEYITVCDGMYPHAHSTIESPIGRHTSQRQKMTITHKGKSATTEIYRLTSTQHNTLLRVILHTGRTHQIRVHLAHTGFPITGDGTYGKRGDEHRILLHAGKLTFVPLDATDPVTVYAPLPQDMAERLQELGYTKTDIHDLLPSHPHP